MTRHHFQELADMIRRHLEVADHCMSPTADKARYDEIVSMAVDLAAICRANNPRFKSDTFYRACGLPHLASN